MSDDLHQNPYQSFGRPDPAPGVADLPDHKRSPVPRVIGTLNILFGLALGLCGLCQGISFSGQAAAAPQVRQIFQQQQDELQRQVDELKAQRAQEANDQTSQKMGDQIDDLTEKMGVLEIMPDPMTIWGLDKPHVIGFFAIECVLALLLNLFMFISGVGLLSFNEWARKMALWVATLKLANIVIVAVFMLTIIAPAMLESMQEFMLQVVQEQEAAEPVPIAEIRKNLLVGISIMFSLFAAASAIYPVICLWQLNRSLVKKSCQTKVIAAA